MKHNRWISKAGALCAVIALSVAAPCSAEVVASAGWVQATAAGSRESLGYLVLTNNGAEERKLLRIASPASDLVSLHMSSIDSEGRKRLWPLASLSLEPGQSIRFEPNARLIRFRDLNRSLVAGEKVVLQLQFDGGEAPISIELEVRS